MYERCSCAKPWSDSWFLMEFQNFPTRVINMELLLLCNIVLWLNNNKKKATQILHGQFDAERYDIICLVLAQILHKQFYAECDDRICTVLARILHG